MVAGSRTAHAALDIVLCGPSFPEMAKGWERPVPFPAPTGGGLHPHGPWVSRSWGLSQVPAHRLLAATLHSRRKSPPSVPMPTRRCPMGVPFFWSALSAAFQGEKNWAHRSVSGEGSLPAPEPAAALQGPPGPRAWALGLEPGQCRVGGAPTVAAPGAP